MRIATHNHNYGDRAIPSRLQREVVTSLGSIDFHFTRNCASGLRAAVLQRLQELGWSGRARVDGDSKITVSSMNGTVALCLQTGNMSRIYADLLKLQVLYARGKASAAIMILPTKDSARKMGENLANFDRLVSELMIYKDILSIPMVVMGLE